MKMLACCIALLLLASCEHDVPLPYPDQPAGIVAKRRPPVKPDAVDKLERIDEKLERIQEEIRRVQSRMRDTKRDQ